MSRARIVIADDHELFREGLANLIDAQPDLEVVGQAGDGFEALTLARDLHPDLILMDINMPICDGLEATRLIRAARDVPDPKIIVLTIHDEDEMLFEAIKAGATGYILKDSSAPEFAQGVRSALAGGLVLPPKLAVRLREEFARVARRPGPASAAEDGSNLTTREIEILSLIAANMTDKGIAAQLALSVHTVKTHVRSILSKLHAVNRRQAAQMAAQQGLLRDGGG